MKRKVFVMAWDGATLDLVGPWIEAGLLPNLRRVIEQGTWGTLRSTIPPVSPVAWQTFFTGKNPGRHGVFDFFRPIRQRYTDLIPATSTLSREPTLWGRLSQAGRKSIVVNVPMTFPAEAIDGIVISGAPSPLIMSKFSYPPQILDELNAKGWDLTRDATSPMGAFDQYYHYLEDLVNTRTAATLYLMEQYPWDFFMVHYLETDQVQHSYWRVLNTDSPNANAILHLYQMADQSLGQILDQLPPDTSLILMSDHGMGPTEYHVHLNNWLLKEGFMRWRARLSTNLRRLLYALGLSPTSIYNHLPSNLIRRISFGEVRTGLIQFDPLRSKPVRSSLIAHLKKSLVRAPVMNFDDIDWDRTRAYSVGTTGAGLIYINVRGREPNGIVEPGPEYESVRDAIAQKLTGLIDPFSGQPLVREVLRREQVYEGEQVFNAPDLLVLYRGGEYDSKKGTVFLSKNIVDRVKDGNATHRLMGLIALSGAGIAPGGRLRDMNILDVAPTIMRLLGEPVPSDFEGQVILAAMDESLPQADYPLSQAGSAPATTAQPDMTPEELSQVLEKLKALGYVE